jgi:hypothetical protein
MSYRTCAGNGPCGETNCGHDRYGAADLPERFERIVQSRDTANKATEHRRINCVTDPRGFLERGRATIGAVQPVHVATRIEAGTRGFAAPSVTQRLVAIGHLFDRVVTGQIIQVNLSASVREPRHVVTPV